jgi:putative OPT family oligopeptide transporter
VLFGVLFGAANAYLGLLAGITVSTSIPVAVMTVGFFRLTGRLFGRSTILESNMAQTIGSASSSLASGVIFTIPALYIWGVDPTLFQLTGLALFGGLLGVLFMIPLRRFLIKEEHASLPYPEGTACARVLITADKGGAGAGNLFLGLGLGVLYRCCNHLLKIIDREVSINLPLVKKAQVGIVATPMLMGVGYILGYRVSAIMVAGSLLSWVVLIPLMGHMGEHLTVPLFPEAIKTIGSMSPAEIWTRYIRYVGAGAVAFGGLITIARSLPMMIKSFRMTFGAMRKRLGNDKLNVDGSNGAIRTERDLSIRYVLFGVAAVVVLLAVLPGVLGLNTTFVMRLVAAPAIAIFAFFFVSVSSRIVGMIGVSSNPTSGMTIVTLLAVSGLFVWLGWTDMLGKVTALTIGTVVCVAASIAGDTSQDLKTGFLVGATPWRQQVGELIGAVTSSLAVCAAVMVLVKTYEIGSPDLPAPQAMLIGTLVDGVLESGIPWSLVLIGAFLGAIVELCSLPSLPFAVGLYLPVATMTPILFGGIIRRIVEARSRHDEAALIERRGRGILFCSGLIGGEGLMGVIIAAYAYGWGKPTGLGWSWPEPWGKIVALGLFGLMGLLLYRTTKTD